MSHTENKSAVTETDCPGNFNCPAELCPAVIGGTTSGIGTSYPNPDPVAGNITRGGGSDIENLLALDTAVINEVRRRRLTEINAASGTISPSPVTVINKIRRNLRTLGLGTSSYIEKGSKVQATQISEIAATLRVSQVGLNGCVCDTRCACNTRTTMNCASRCFCDCHCQTHCYCNTRDLCNCIVRYILCTCFSRGVSEYRCECNSQNKGINNDGVIIRYDSDTSCINNTAPNSCEGEVPGGSIGTVDICTSRTGVQCPCNLRCNCDTRCGADMYFNETCSCDSRTPA